MFPVPAGGEAANGPRSGNADEGPDGKRAETEQVAFCTQNIVNGIDFTNDPLLQGRNFSYLDTQLKRLGSPNFTYLPVNAPRCPIAHFQQDGHMAMGNPGTRANYEPNSWDAAEGGPREDPARGFRSYPAAEAGDKRRLRAESFADHYSQARLFYLSQTKTERRHIENAFTFELSKCDEPAIRARMVAGLRNVDEDLARAVAVGLGLRQLPDKVPAAVEPRRDPARNGGPPVAGGPPRWVPLLLGLREDLGELRREGRKIVRLTACDQGVRAVGVLHHLLVHPGPARVLDVGPQAGPGGDGAAVDHARLDQRPRRVADRGDRLARVEEAPHERDGFAGRAQLVGVGHPARQDQACVVLHEGLADRHVDLLRVAAVKMLEQLDLVLRRGNEHGTAALIDHGLPGLLQLRLLGSLAGDEKGHCRGLQRTPHCSFPFSGCGA
jgi:hypothetical protein